MNFKFVLSVSGTSCDLHEEMEIVLVKRLARIDYGFTTAACGGIDPGPRVFLTNTV